MTLNKIKQGLVKGKPKINFKKGLEITINDFIKVCIAKQSCL